MAFQTEYSFDELKLPGLGEGVLIYGQAKLEDNGDGYFAITSITLDGRRTLPAPSRSGSNTFDQMLCRMIMDVLYDDSVVLDRNGKPIRTHGIIAAEEWAEAVEKSSAQTRRRFVGPLAARLEYHFLGAAE